jgi:hypothetical protein
MPMHDFVELYVKLRHGHHYDPSVWPLALWICFFWATPLAIWAVRRLMASPTNVVDPDRRDRIRQISRIYLVYAGLLAVALIGAGLFYFNETLIQLSLYRFSIYFKMLNCIGAAYLIYNDGILKRFQARIIIIGLPAIMIGALIVLFFTDGFGFSSVKWLAGFVWRHRGPIGLAVILSSTLAIYELIYALPRAWGQNLLHGSGIAALILIVLISWGRWLGVDTISDDDDDYLRLCAWVKQNTSMDAIFLVPPQEQSFRVHAGRAIVVNFKGVPQLSGELPEWRRRLERVLNMSNILDLERPFESALPDMGRRYDALPAQHLVDVAREYHAEYVVAGHPLANPSLAPVYGDEKSRYFLYHLNP